MGWLIAFVFLVWPISEILAFGAVVDRIGWSASLLLLGLSAAVGILLLRANGLAIAANARNSLNRGEMPVGALFDGACIAIAAVLMILPGFVSDLIGLFLLVPAVRQFLGRMLARHVVVLGGGGAPMGPERRGPSSPTGGPGVIDGEYEVVDRNESTRPDKDDDGDSDRKGTAGCAPGTSVIATDRPESRSEK